MQEFHKVTLDYATASGTGIAPQPRDEILAAQVDRMRALAADPTQDMATGTQDIVNTQITLRDGSTKVVGPTLLANEEADSYEGDFVHHLLGVPEISSLLEVLSKVASALSQTETRGGKLAGVKLEDATNNASPRLQLMLLLGYNITPGSKFIGPAQVPDLNSLGLSKLERLLQESANIEPMLVGKALVYVGAVWVLLGASRSLDDISGKRTSVTLEALAKSQKPSRYDPALSFLLGSFGIQLETAPETSLPGFSGFVATIYIVANSLLREPGQPSLRKILAVSPRFESFCRAMSKRRVLQIERSASLCLSSERTKGD